MRISDWSSDVCSSDLLGLLHLDDAQRGTVMKRMTWLVPALYILFLMVPIYWLLNMSFKTTNEILGSFTLWPQTFTFSNYEKIFTDPTWYSGYVNSIIYVTINTLISASARSEEHTSELQSLMRISYAVFCLKKTHIINQKSTIIEKH